MKEMKSQLRHSFHYNSGLKFEVNQIEFLKFARAK